MNEYYDAIEERMERYREMFAGDPDFDEAEAYRMAREKVAPLCSSNPPPISPPKP
jgi:hypothetical protein